MAYCSLRRRVPLRGTSILRLWRGPFGFIGRRLSGQARRLFGLSQTRKSLCGTPVSKGLLVSYAILYFHSQPARYVAYERGKYLSTSLPMMIRGSALHSWHTDRCVEGCLFEAHLSCAFGAPLLQGATRIICNIVLSFLSLLVTSHTSAAKISRLRFR